MASLDQKIITITDPEQLERARRIGFLQAAATAGRNLLEYLRPKEKIPKEYPLLAKALALPTTYVNVKLKELGEALRRSMYTGRISPEDALSLAGWGTAGGAPGAPKPVPGTVDVGILKSQLLMQLLKLRHTHRGITVKFSPKGLAEFAEAFLATPQRELSHFRKLTTTDVASATFRRGEKAIGLNLVDYNPEASWFFHELAHARQWSRKVDPRERFRNLYMIKLRDETWPYMQGLVREGRIRAIHDIDPVELHAELVEKSLEKLGRPAAMGRAFGRVYREALDDPRISYELEKRLPSVFLESVAKEAARKAKTKLWKMP